MSGGLSVAGACGISRSMASAIFPPLYTAMQPPQEEIGDSDEDFKLLLGPADEGDEESCSYGGAEDTDADEVGGGAVAVEEEDGTGAEVSPTAASESSDLDAAEENRRFWETCLQSGYP